MYRLPDITFKVVSSITVDFVSVRAEWKSPDGMNHTILKVMPTAELTNFFGSVMHDTLNKIRETEEARNGQEEERL